MSYPPRPIGIEFNNNQSSSHSFSDNEIAALGFEPCAASPPPAGAPAPPSNVWAYAGHKIAGAINLWILKRLGWLLIIGALQDDD